MDLNTFLFLIMQQSLHLNTLHANYFLELLQLSCSVQQNNNCPVNSDVHEYLFFLDCIVPKMHTALLSCITNFAHANKSSHSNVCKIGWSKVCEGHFYTHLDKFGQFPLFWLWLSITKMGTKLDQRSFVVCVAWHTTEDYLSRCIILLRYKNGQWHEQGKLWF